MKNTREREELDELIAKRSPGYLAMGFLFVVVLLSLAYSAWFGSNSSGEMDRFTMAGTYTLDDENIEYRFWDFDRISCEGAEKIHISGHSKKAIDPGEEVFFQVHRERVIVKINHETVFVSSSEWNGRWDSFTSEGITPDDLITITIEGIEGVDADTSMMRTINKIYYGDRFEMFAHQANKNMTKLIFCGVILIMGITQLFTAMTLILMETRNIRGTVSCGLLMINGAACCLIDYDYISLLLPNETAIYFIDIGVQLSSCLFLIINMMFHVYTKRNWTRSKHLLVAWLILLAVYCVGHFVIRIDIPEITWMTGMAALNGVFLIAELVMLISDYRVYRERKVFFIIVSSSILTICMLIEIIHFVWHYYFLVYPFQIGLMCYSLFQCVVVFQQAREREIQSRKAAKLEKELLQSQVAIMLSQIRPHFLYNSITAIQTLCVQDPEKARKSLGDFAKYLRGNMDSLASKELIPFVKELEHTRHYVELELMRQGEYLEVDYDIEEVTFFIPTLTLQPLVENAIKHGVGAKEEGGRVIISTYRKNNKIYVTVEDDGVGFDAKDLDEISLDKHRSHIGLNNVRERIQRMADGDFVIESQIGVGTVATIILPQEE